MYVPYIYIYIAPYYMIYMQVGPSRIHEFLQSKKRNEWSAHVSVTLAKSSVEPDRPFGR